MENFGNIAKRAIFADQRVYVCVTGSLLLALGSLLSAPDGPTDGRAD